MRFQIGDIVRISKNAYQERGIGTIVPYKCIRNGIGWWIVEENIRLTRRP